MIGSCNCPITGVRLHPTVRLYCLITTLQINESKKKVLYGPIKFEEIVIVINLSVNYVYSTFFLIFSVPI